MYLDANTLYGWVKNLLKFKESFIKAIMKIVIEGIFLK